MTSFAESESNGEKTAPKPTTSDEAEKGVVKPQERRKAVSWRRLTSKKDTAPIAIKGEPASASRSGPGKQTVSSAILTPQPSQPSSATESAPKSEVSSLLCIYVTENNINMLKSQIQSLKTDDMLESAGFTTQDAAGNGLLQIAALHGHLDILKVLLEQGININALDRNHGTALQAAIYMGHQEIYEELLNWGKTSTNLKDVPGQKSLHFLAAHKQPTVPKQEQVVENTRGKIEVDTNGGYYGCALQVAAYRANSELVRRLIDLGANVNLCGGKYGYPLQAAVRTGSMAVVNPILSHPEIIVNAKGGRYSSSLQAVARGEYRTRIDLPEIARGQILKQLAKNAKGQSVARNGEDPKAGEYVKIAQALFEKGALLDGGSGRLDNPINAAASSGSQQMLKLMLDNFEDKTKRFKDWTEDDSDVLTKALLTAITRAPKNPIEVVKLLVQRGAKIQYERSTVLPNLPLEAAATKNLLEVVKYLLKTRDNFGNFADTLAVSGIHGTALRAAIAAAALRPDHEDIAVYLIKNIAEQWGKKEIFPPGPDEIRPPEGGSSQSIDEPQSQKPIRRDTHGKSLDWTKYDAEYGNLIQLATFAGLKRTVSLLLRYGAEPNVRDTSQRTALHIAAWSGFPQIVQLLLERRLPERADVTLRDEWGATPLDQAEESLDRDGHPGATETNLQNVIQILRGEMGVTDSEKPGTEFRGPKRSVAPKRKESKVVETVLAKPVFSMPSWIPGVGFRASIIDIWEADNQECLLLKKPKIDEILYHKAVLDGIMTPPGATDKKENKLRWIHIPTNNMTWVEMLITSICQEKKMPAYKSLWGVDPFYTSPELSPHARFIAPQCGRLVRDGSNIQGVSEQLNVPTQPHLEVPGTTGAQPLPNISTEPKPISFHTEKSKEQPTPLFLAMPYIHWESHIAQKALSEMITEVKDETMKTPRHQKNKTPLWPDEKGNETVVTKTSADEAGYLDGMREKVSKDVASEISESEEDYHELLRKYLFKRRPVHLRRTLDQYYYSHLADTNVRDSDQIVMRRFNEDKKKLKLNADTKYADLLRQKADLKGFEKHPISTLEYERLSDAEYSTGSTSTNFVPNPEGDTSADVKPIANVLPEVKIWERIVNKLLATQKRKELKDVYGKLHKIDQALYYDDNSPILMIDQLWLWIIDEETIVTSFPHRQNDRNTEDLDATDQTDVLKTIVSYLHTSRRPEINTSHALAELIISQCVGILHKADLDPDLDFLKNYSVQSNKWADKVMQMLSNFVVDFEEFMIWIKEQPAESEESIRRFERIFSVTEQTQLLRNIQDIKDELGMLKAVFDDQIQVLTAASGLIEEADFQCIYGCIREVAALEHGLRCVHSGKRFVDQSSKHLKLVERMQVQSNQAYDTLRDLLNLKQQQAYVLEARVSRNQAISSGEQSKTIMVFTIVTIIFLPLTFITTIFTLPIAEFHRVVLPEGSDFPPTPFLRKSYILKYILIVTFTVAVPLIIAAFEIQSLQNGWKKLRLKLAKRKRVKELKALQPSDDGMPEFLKGNEKVKTA
ncbi:hypothetical protein BP6252_14169 [Coleophoma cylindrospora]|uniref:Uncharacterized protein n=1 Tax=Coleophoma cylindrospora TaxID=1849047 RepID=A0A3D8Q3D9_9HELO|nr:hypothetical protein BP6252_14169 [Coleophoma cylindrospora]